MSSSHKKSAAWIVVLRLAADSPYRNYLEEMGFHFEEEAERRFMVGILGKPGTRDLRLFTVYREGLDFCSHYLRGFDCSVVMRPDFEFLKG